MTGTVVFNAIKDFSDSELVQRIERTYTDAFPAVERRDFSLLRELVLHEPCFTLYALSSEAAYIGFLSAWQFDAFTYIEHFAIEADVRNQGWGELVLKRFSKQTHPIVLEVELPGDEWSTRRIGFYKRMGFVRNPQPYLQPPYRTGDPWTPMCLMIYGSLNPNCPFEEVKRIIYRQVYNHILS